MKMFRHCLFSISFILLSALSFAGDSSSATSALPIPININTADAVTLSQVLKGIGASKAKAIVSYRENYGAFKSIDELKEVKGIGSSLISMNRTRIKLE